MISLKSKDSKQKGFTIVELLIVIVVIGILAAIAFVAYGNVTKKARDSERTADAKALSSKAEEYYANNAVYPTVAQLLAMQGLNEASKNTPAGNIAQSCGDTIATVGASPLTVGSVAVGGAGNDRYCYVLTTNGAGFQIVYWDEAGNTTKAVTGSNNQ